MKNRRSMKLIVGRLGMDERVTKFSQVWEGLLETVSNDRIAPTYIVLDAAKVGFCQVGRAEGGFRIEWREDFAPDGPQLGLTRAHFPGSTRQRTCQWNAPSQGADTLPLGAAFEVLRTFFYRQPRPKCWLWLPVILKAR